jgi:L-asparaginase II
MPSHQLRIETTRGNLVEAVHRVAVAVVAESGALLGASGNPELSTWWRSAAKPFQALPLIQDGAADAFQLSDEEVALTCASHSSEPRHLEVVSSFMAKVGITDQQLSCGVHPPLSPLVAQEVSCGRAVATPRWSNCSGKHTGMLALARHHGWPLEGYHAAGHPVQQRILDEVARWTGLQAADMALSVDGCTAVCFGLPLQAMALAYARLAASSEAAAVRVRAAMMAHPFLVAGTGRLCTDLMQAWPGRIVAKVGAEGIYCAALPALGLGIALKVEDGDSRAASPALLEALAQVLAHVAPELKDFSSPELARHGRQPIRNTRGSVTGELRAAGSLRFFAA